MKNAVRMSALIAVAAGMVAGCTGDDGGTARPTTSVTATSSVPVEPPVEQTISPSPGTPSPGRPSAEVPPVIDSPVPSDPEPPVVTPPADDISGPDRCVDPGSSGVRKALAGLGDGWAASQASEDRPGSCGQLLWVRAVGGNSAGAPIHILFFHDGKYLGTATSEAYAFTYVAGASGNSVTVNYKWLVGDEPFAAPQGGPAAITYSWTGSGVAMSGPLPSEVTQPHR
ncbi:LppP/LprE family lipoprotein [Nocardia sp. JW2]|uniref:LppP/LprE family lipoprotein n=1 Tax=Nocardia sp. JW2 TaxID=3450738 RepID=UPI003F43C72B